MNQLPPPAKPEVNYRIKVHKQAYLLHTIDEAVAYLDWINEELNKVYKGAPYYTLHRQNALLDRAAHMYGELLCHYDTVKTLYPTIFKESLYHRVTPRMRVMGYKPVER